MEKLKEGAEVLVRWLTMVQRSGTRNSLRAWLASPEQARRSVGPDWTRAIVTQVVREEGAAMRSVTLAVIYVEGDMKDEEDLVPVSEVRRADPPGAIVSWPICRAVSGAISSGASSSDGSRGEGQGHGEGWAWPYSCMQSCTTGVPDLVQRVPTALLSHPLVRKG